MTLGEALGLVGVLGSADGLLGRDPAAPPEPAPARAVDDRSVETHPVGHEAPATLVVHEGGRAAAALWVVLGGGIAEHAGDARQVAILAVADEPTSLRLGPWKALMPSRASGVGFPSLIVEPLWLKVT